MIRVLFVLIVFIVSFGCNSDYFNYYFEHEESFMSVEEICKWVYDTVEYKHDAVSGGEAQLPEETYRIRTGDCEDQALLIAYFLYDIGEIPYIAFTRKHVYVFYRGVCYDSGGLHAYTDSIIYVMSFREAIEWARKY